MNQSRTVFVMLAACLACSIVLSDDVESTTESRPAEADETHAAHLQESVDFYESGEFERSLQAALDALRILNGHSAVAYNNICSAHARMGANGQAIAACIKALELAPGFERARNNLAGIYEGAVEQAPTAGAYLNLSVARYWQDRLDESVAAARKALELDPDSAIAHNNICAAFAKGGAWSRAIPACEMALAIDPDYELARNNLAWARSGAGD